MPRSLFFQSELYHRLNQTGSLTAGTILENAQVVWRNITKANEDAIHAVINVGDLLYADWSTVEDMATRDLDGNAMATWVHVNSYLPLLGIPWAAIASIPYEPLRHSPSASYTWSSGSTTTVSIWEALWAGAAEILDVTLEYVASAIAFYVDFYQVVAESLVQFGLWVRETVSNNASRIEAMVKDAQEAFGQFGDWVFHAVVDALKTAIRPILDAIQVILDATVGDIAEQMATVAQGPGAGFEPALLRATERVFLMATVLAAVPIAIRTAELAAQALTAGISWLVTKLVSKTVLKFIVEYLAFAALTTTAGVVISDFLEDAGWIADSTVGFLETVAFPTELIALGSAVAYVLGQIILDRMRNEVTPLKSWRSLGLSLSSLLLVLLGSSYQSGTALAALDVSALLTAIAGLVFYYFDSKKALRKTIDLPHSLALTFEQSVAYVSPAVALGEIGAHVSGGDYAS
jgi:hypothetical protein